VLSSPKGAAGLAVLPGARIAKYAAAAAPGAAPADRGFHLTIMSQKCDRCGKGPMAGNNVSHSKVRTRRRFMPNLQSTRVLEGSRWVKTTLCTRCIRTASKQTP